MIDHEEVNIPVLDRDGYILGDISLTRILMMTLEIWPGGP
jgi:hypothetical protein